MMELPVRLDRAAKHKRISGTGHQRWRLPLPTDDPTHKQQKENTVSKNASTSSVYRVTELIGTSEISWEDAAKHAVETATKTLRDLRVAEVEKLDLVIVDGKVTAYRARVSLSFKYEEKE
jgi:dodecin